MHGKTFAVEDAVARFERVERIEHPEDIKRVMPWVRHAFDKRSGRTLLYVKGPKGRIPVAEVMRSGVGVRDDRGSYRPLISNRAMNGAGIGLPPFHGNCRSTVASA
jgi:hypothetical protein